MTKREEGKRGWNGPTSSPAWYGAAAGEVYTVQYYSTVGGQGHQDYSGREGRRTAAAAASSSLFPSLSAQRPRKAGGGGCPRPVCVGREREKGLSSIARGGERREREREEGQSLPCCLAVGRPLCETYSSLFAKGPLSHEPREGNVQVPFRLLSFSLFGAVRLAAVVGTLPLLVGEEEGEERPPPGTEAVGREGLEG